MIQSKRNHWFDWRDFLHLPGIVPSELTSVRVGSIVGVLIGGLVGAYFFSGMIGMVVGGFAGGYAGQTGAFILRRVMGEDFLAILLRVILRIAFGAAGAAGVTYGIYGAVQIASNGRLFAIGGVAFFACPGICALVAAVAPNLLFRYSKPAIGLTLGGFCLLLTLTVIVSMALYPSFIWIIALAFCAVSDFAFLGRPGSFPMSPEEAFWGPKGIYGLILLPSSRNRESPTVDPEHTDN